LKQLIIFRFLSRHIVEKGTSCISPQNVDTPQQPFWFLLRCCCQNSYSAVTIRSISGFDSLASERKSIS